MILEINKGEKMIKEILTYEKNKDILTQKSEEVKEINNDIRELVQDLKDTLKAHPTGVGISAIQIGVPKQVCIIKYNRQMYTLINPQITRKRGTTLFTEGCLSAPGKRKKVSRANKVWCNFLDENGNQKTLADGGLCSIIIQHELDHFNGWCEVFTEYDNEENE